MNKPIWSLCIWFSLACVADAQVHIWRFNGVKITSLDLVNAPIWEDKDKNPPLSVRDAIASAKKHFVKHAPSMRPWELVAVRLTPLDEAQGFWVYEIQYREYPNPKYTHEMLRVSSVVLLMNGKVVEPEDSEPGKGVPFEP